MGKKKKKKKKKKRVPIYLRLFLVVCIRQQTGIYTVGHIISIYIYITGVRVLHSATRTYPHSHCYSREAEADPTSKLAPLLPSNYFYEDGLVALFHIFILLVQTS